MAFTCDMIGGRKRLAPLTFRGFKCAMPRALLFKTKSKPTDPYDEAFRQKTPFIPVFVSVLAHQRVNEPQLREILRNEPSKRYAALIVTSQRAVEALADAMSTLTGDESPAL